MESTGKPETVILTPGFFQAGPVVCVEPHDTSSGIPPSISLVAESRGMCSVNAVVCGCSQGIEKRGNCIWMVGKGFLGVLGGAGSVGGV